MNTTENHLIELLSNKDRKRLLLVSEVVALELSEVLYDAQRPPQHVYFPTEGYISLLTQIDDHPTLEVGMVGREGMAGGPLTQGAAVLPVQTWVQGAGSARRMRVSALRREMSNSPAIRRTLERYVSVLMAQMVRSASCLRFHMVGPRLARWLLMSQDRAGADHFSMTHEFLAAMLGVRRVGVTQAAGVLQTSGLITYHRGEITVLDRAGLKRAACSCYGDDRQIYGDVLGPARLAA